MPPLVEDALFHGQQAVEKALKAFLTAHDRVFPKTHDLDEPSTACEAVDPELRGVLHPARDLSVFAWQFRYPGETEVPPKEEAESVLRIAHSAFDAMLERLPREAGP